MSASAIDITKIRKRYAHDIASDLTARTKILNDPDITEDGKKKKVDPVTARIAARYEADLKAAAAVVQNAEARYQEFRAINRQRAMAFQTPERAAAMRSLAMNSSPGELMALAQQAASAEDGVAAYGLRQGMMEALTTMSEQDRAEIGAVLNKPLGGGEERTLAELVGARVELARFQADGESGDAIFGDPVKALAGLREALVIHSEDGDVLSLSPTRADFLCELAEIEPIQKEKTDTAIRA